MRTVLLVALCLSSVSFARPRHRHGHRGPDRNHAQQQPVAYAMPDESFAVFIERLDAASFSSDRIGLIDQVGAYNQLSVSQLGRVLRELGFSSEREHAIVVMGPRVVDPQNGFMLDEALNWSSERDLARQYVGRR